MSDPVIGRSFGPYCVTALLGKGGMGEVYVAVDERLGRRVALKFLPDRATEERRARFTAEARAASALHHPNIVTIFDVGTADGRDYLAMELVEGESLRGVLESRRLTIQRCVEIASDIAAALAAGHAAGIVHRDVKPENIVITSSGQAKLLDYGLAKIIAPPVAPGMRSSTMKLGPQPTEPGMLLGTIAYMSPEQAEGSAVDHRSDIFSLGAVFYEMLAGRPPFTGKSSVDVLHKIIAVEPPPVHSLNPKLPPRVNDILDKALAKDPVWRYASAADFRLDLLRMNRGEGQPLKIRTTPSAALTLSLLVLTVALAALAAWQWRRTRVATTTAQRDVRLAQLTDDPGYEGDPTFSPDAQTIAYTSDRSGNFEIYLKQISGGPDVNLTNDPADDVQPSFSPDGKQIAFVSGRSSKTRLIYRNPNTPLLGGDIWVMSALGGTPRKVAEEGNFPSWSPDGKSILFTAGPWNGQRIYRVPTTGGKPVEVPVRFAAPHLFLFHPHYSPDGKWIVYGAQGDNIYLVPATGGAETLVAGGRTPAWNRATNAIIYSRADRNFSLWQIPFDTASGRAGAQHPLTVGRGRDIQASVAPDGKSIAFAAENFSFNIERLPFDEESGKVLGPPEPITRGHQTNYFFSIAPDSRSVVYESMRGRERHLWRADIGKPAIQLTGDPELDDRQPAWSPDGTRIAFLRRPAGTEGDPPPTVYVMRADGGDPQPLVKGHGFLAWTPDSRGIGYWNADDKQAYVLDLSTGRSRPLTAEAAVRSGMQFSPDGQWMTFQSLGTHDGSTDVRAVNLEGGPAFDVVATPREDFHPWFSPSGRWVYAQFDHKNIVRVPGPAQQWRKATAQQVTFFPESNLYIEQPQMSADGKWIYYSRGNITADLWVLRLGIR
ncbi:MAG TPA: protein kinase [Thermoanaerobaculia bacterium]|nr:protein kinase [Thermoanaerobaculia bacterium]